MINFFNNKYYKIFLFRYVCNTIMENNTINILVISEGRPNVALATASAAAVNALFSH